jgi:FAD/FMN-containing dehydrogenase/Fe-S oxidoreductase
MIPRLAHVDKSHDSTLAFLAAARAAGFKGELESRYADRIAAATDNSIYQILPQAVAYPRDTGDVVILARLADEPRFHDIVLSPRGGGTGTNGQSLTDGVIVDLSRHMTQILEIDPRQRIARVQAGVVKDQLEAALKPHGLFFAPELSTSNRATIGGMIATDASGQGSCLFGKTRDHVLALRSVFLGGAVWDSQPTDTKEFARICARQDRIGALCRVAAEEVDGNAELIRERFPKLNRSLTGYDLAHARDGAGRFDLNALLCGAEGTLAFAVEATINLTAEPRCRALVNIGYASFDEALRSAQALMAARPASIETVDSTVLDLARNDIVWDGVRDAFPPDEAGVLRGVNLVEFIADDEAELESRLRGMTDRLDAVAQAAGLGYRVVRGDTSVKRVWAMRKRAVGLLGNVTGERRPVPFVEDTAVPPESLADYIAEFRAVLDREGLFYGMFGHVDAGVLHVRPALDMKDPEDETRVRRITDEVVALTRKYRGLLWGEHGKGMRSEYVPEFFGPLYPSLQRIKAAADPRNQMNPGKICAPPGHEARLAKIDGTPTRGQCDRTIPLAARREFEPALTCNGNGACFNFDPNDAMCPSWKATHDRVHSPKGRAALMREWLRLLALSGAKPEAGTAGLLVRMRNTLGTRGAYDFSHEVRDAMAGCLSCKSCATQCPIHVDVAELRSQFLEIYHGRYLRPLRHHAVSGLENMLPVAARMPRLYNAAGGGWIGRSLTRRFVGLVDTPRLAGIDLRAELCARGIAWADPAALAALAPEAREIAVVVVQDAFTTYFETRVLLAALDLLTRLGFVPLLAPFMANGKALHVHGFRARFGRVAARNAAYLRTLAASGVPLVGIEPAVTLTYRQEYAAALGGADAPSVQLLQEWLASKPEQLRAHAGHAAEPFELLAHCTERTSTSASVGDWQRVFAALGQTLTVPPLGCCGMAGTYGHETEHAELSRRIYAQSWAAVVNDPARRGRLVATGYSCRSQAKRIDGVEIAHPVQALLVLLATGDPGISAAAFG